MVQTYSTPTPCLHSPIFTSKGAKLKNQRWALRSGLNLYLLHLSWGCGITSYRKTCIYIYIYNIHLYVTYTYIYIYVYIIYIYIYIYIHIYIYMSHMYIYIYTYLYWIYKDVAGFQRSRFLHPSDAADRSLGGKEGNGGGPDAGRGAPARDFTMGPWLEKNGIIHPGWWFGCHFWHFPIYWEFHHPNWLSYFSEGFKPPTSKFPFIP